MLRSDPTATAAPELERSAAPPQVRHLRQVLLWPLRLLPVERHGGPQHQRPWQLLREMGDASPWREVIDEYTGEHERFHERHYNEFVAFLPYVQRFLYGEGRASRSSAISSNARARSSAGGSG